MIGLGSDKNGNVVPPVIPMTNAWQPICFWSSCPLLDSEQMIPMHLHKSRIDKYLPERMVQFILFPFPFLYMILKRLLIGLIICVEMGVFCLSGLAPNNNFFNVNWYSITSVCPATARNRPWVPATKEAGQKVNFFLNLEVCGWSTDPCGWRIPIGCWCLPLKKPISL